jgi:coenzyme PQQ precursor peptide PqqA
MTHGVPPSKAFHSRCPAFRVRPRRDKWRTQCPASIDVKRARGNPPLRAMAHRKKARQTSGKTPIAGPFFSPYFAVMRRRNWPSRWDLAHKEKETTMSWTTPTLVEICIGLEINGYLPAEF